MAHFDASYLEEVARRVARLRPDARPRWGSLDGARMIQHLHGALRYSLGQLPEVKPLGRFTLRYLIGPLALHGLLPVPRNVTFRRPDGSVIPIPMQPGGAPELLAAGREFLERLADPEFHPPAHPAFGNLGPRGWSRLHYHHFQHHLGQFGI
jgi:Protein of unknown function (DUF1569)